MKTTLHLINDSTPERGGAQKILSKLNTVDKYDLGFKSLVFSKSWMSEQKEPHQICGGRYWFIVLLGLLFKSRPDVVVIHSRMLLPFVFVSKLLGINVVYYCHAQYRRFPTAFKFFPCDLYVAVSESVSEYLSSYVPKNKIVINHNPVAIDVDSFSTEISRFQFNYVGSLHPWKGLSTFVKNLNSYCEKKDVCCQVDVVGEGPEMDFVKSMSLTKGMNIIFHGYQPMPFEVLPNNSVHVIPSLEEGFGIAAVEAIQAGRPVLYSDIPALNEVMEGDVLAKKYVPDDYASFELALDELAYLLKDGIDLDVLKARANRAKKRFGMEAFKERYKDVFKRVERGDS